MICRGMQIAQADAQTDAAAGGDFTTVGGNASSYIAKWYRPTDCSGLLPPGFAPPPGFSGGGLMHKEAMGPAAHELPGLTGNKLFERRSISTPLLNSQRTANARGERIVSTRPSGLFPSGRTRAALQFPDGTTRDLATLAGPNGAYSEGVAINNHGEVIGWSEPLRGSKSPLHRVPFFWTRDTGMHDLSTVLDPDDPASRGLHIEELHALSDDRVVTGIGLLAASAARSPRASRPSSSRAFPHAASATSAVTAHWTPRTSSPSS